jgi:ornithine carbamoyltransferase
MKRMATIITVLAGLALAVACADAPVEQINALDTEMRAARTDIVRTYAPEALEVAEQAAAEFQQELAAQREKFVFSRDYEHAVELADIARAEAQAAVKEAGEAKDLMREQTRAAIDEAHMAVDEAAKDLGTAPVGKGNRAELEAMKSELDAAEATFEEMEQQLRDEQFQVAKSMAEEARATAMRISAAVRTARALKGAGGRTT